MAFVSELVGGEEGTAGELTEEMEPENEPLLLPSHFKPDERAEHGIPDRMVTMERDIREAHAETVLAELRVLISTFGGFAGSSRA